jgi:hypothetical protein
MQAEDPEAEETKKESGKTVNEQWVNERTKMRDYNIRPFKEVQKYE